MTSVHGGWLESACVQRVLGMLADAGHAGYAVGGCVRDALLERPVSDVDIATSATPETVMKIAKAKGLKAIPTGIEHGTVTVVSDGSAFEITTFRKDIETDGRRAVVAFSKSMEEDAKRRDFTMNALYADATGKVFDPVHGLPDLRARYVRFIDDPAARIREDYLRILRFFRFNAWYGDPQKGMDAEALAAIAANLDGLARLSRERVGAEVKKLLGAPDPAPAVATMQSVGVLGRLLPGADARFLGALVHLEAGETPDAIRRLAVLGGSDTADVLRLSRAEARRLELLREIMATDVTVEETAYRHGVQTAIDVALVRAAVLEMPVQDDLKERALFGAAQKFPLRAADLMDRYEGAALGRALKEREQRWISSGFRLSAQELLEPPE